MKRIFLWTICTLLAVSFVQAEERSEQEMAAIACEQLNKNVTNNATRRASIANIEVLSKKESYRIYGSEATGGFVIVSSDDEFMPVLGYSQTRYDETNIPEGLQWWLEAIDQSLQWRKANSQRAEIVVSYTPTANFVTTTWGQTAPYNNQTPTQSNQHCLTGCVATAMAQVLNYYEYPEQSTGNGYYCFFDSKTGTYLPSNEDPTYYDVTLNTTFDWANMRDSYPTSYAGTTAQKNAVAELMRDCGYASGMAYSAEGSSADYLSAALGMATNFSFNNSYLGFADCTLYTDEELQQIIYRELAAKRPILYSGTDPDNGGHAFLFSGIDEDGKVYVNWGWNGIADGFYDITDLAPTGIQGFSGTDHFNSGCMMIYNIHPRPQESGMSRLPKSQFMMYANGSSEASYNLRVSGTRISFSGSTYTYNNKTYTAGILNTHYLSFIGSFELCAINMETGELNSFTLYNVSQETEVYSGYLLNNSVSVSSLADGTYMVYLGSRYSGDDMIAPVRVNGGSIVYTLTKSGSSLALMNKRIDVPTAIRPTVYASEKQRVQQKAYYDLNGRPLTAPLKGLNIIRQADGSMRKVIRK